MTVPYDPEKSSIFILLAVRGTVVPMVLTRPLFWLLVSMETALLVLKDRYPDDYPELQYGVIGPLVSLLSFLGFVISQQSSAGTSCVVARGGRRPE